LWPSKAATNFYLYIFRRLICRHQTMAKCTPQTFGRGRAPSSMSLPRLTSNSVGCCVHQLNVCGHLRPRCICICIFFVPHLPPPNDGKMYPTNVPSRSRVFFYVPPTADIELGWLLCAPIKRWLSKATAPSPSLLFFVDLFRRPNRRHGAPSRVPPQPRVLPDSPFIAYANFISLLCVDLQNGGHL
jgi:hypothetical protein